MKGSSQTTFVATTSEEPSQALQYYTHPTSYQAGVSRLDEAQKYVIPIHPILVIDIETGKPVNIFDKAGAAFGFRLLHGKLHEWLG